VILVPLKRGFKGVSEAVAMILAFAVLSLTILYAFIYVIPQLTTPAPSLNPGLLGEKLVLYLLRDISGNYTLVVRNNGQVESVIDYLVLASPSGVAQRYILNIKSKGICSYISRTIPPGEVLRINCTGDYIPIGVVSSTGKTYTIDPQLYSLLIEQTTIGLPSLPVYYGSLVTSTSDLLKYLENPSMINQSAVRTSIALQPLDIPINPPIQVNLTTNASILFAGFSWNGTNYTLNLLVIGYFNPGAYISLRDSTGQFKYVNLSKSTREYFRYRIKIEGFRGNASFIDAHGVWDLNQYPDIYVYGRLVLSGVADRVAVYVNGTGEAVVGLDPFVFVGDLDYNGNTETVLVTEDYTYGNSTVINDRRGGVPVVDESSKTMRLVFWNIPIDSNQYSMGVVTLRFFYWDNSQDPLLDNYNRVVLRIGLYDNETASLVYSVSVSYYELVRYRSVEIVSMSWIVKDFLVFIPDTGKTYYVAVEIQDPFYMEGTINDADLIIGIEYVGLMLAARG
jgi:hypothetical protein